MSAPVPENDTQYKPSGSFTPDGAEPVPVFTGGDLQMLMVKLQDAFDLALQNDEVEVERAKAAANGPFCSDGYDAEVTQKRFEGFRDKARNNVKLLAGPGEGAVLIAPWIVTGDSPGINQGSYDGWREVSADLEGIDADSRALKVGSWQSDAGEFYRVNAAQRSREIESLQALATSSHGAMGAVSSIQATISAAAHKFIADRVYQSGKKAEEKSKEFEHFDGDDIAKELFYPRTAFVNARVEEMIQFLCLARSDSQPWVAASKAVAQELQAAVQAAKKIQTSNSTYNSDTNVEDRSEHWDDSGVQGKDSLF